jgi:acylphosphatase
MRAVHLVIHGRVQGVFFRKYTFEKAKALKLKGMVRNLPDGSVEVFAQGDNDRISDFISWCHTGSPASKVESVEQHDTGPADYEDFHIG